MRTYYKTSFQHKVLLLSSSLMTYCVGITPIHHLHSLLSAAIFLNSVTPVPFFHVISSIPCQVFLGLPLVLIPFDYAYIICPGFLQSPILTLYQNYFNYFICNLSNCPNSSLIFPFLTLCRLLFPTILR